MIDNKSASFESRYEDIVTGLICAANTLDILKIAVYEKQAAYNLIADSLHCVGEYLSIYAERLDKLNMEVRRHEQSEPPAEGR